MKTGFMLEQNDSHLSQCIEHCIDRRVHFSYKYLAESSQVQITTDILESELASFDIDRFTTFLINKNITFDVMFVDEYFSILLF